MSDAPAPWHPPTPLPARIETARLSIRPFVADDAPSMLAALDVDRASFLPWLPWVKSDNRNVAECIYQIERFRRGAEDEETNDYVLGLFDRATGEVIGGSGFHRIDRATHFAEVGYWVRADRRASGLCSEAVAAILSWGFGPQLEGGWGFRRIAILCAGRNVASARVPEKLGMRLEARRVKERWVEGIGWDDTLEWALLSSEWDVPGRRRRAPEVRSKA